MKSSREKTLETILVLVTACVVCSWLLTNYSFLLAALVIGVAGLFFPVLADKIDWLWGKFAHVLGTIMNSIFLSLVFLIILLPLALLSRLFSKLSIRLKRGGSSYFHDRNFVYTKESMEQMW